MGGVMAKATRRSRASRGSKKRSPRGKTAGAAAVTAADVAGAAHRPHSVPDDEIEIALAAGEHSGLLEDIFGASEFAELRRLSQEAAARSVRGGPRVLILPGIMGSKLGPSDNDAIWIDPIEIAFGKLSDLSLRRRSRAIKAIGVMLFAYLKLKLRLRIAGYDADFHPFDWRRSVVDLGKGLAARIRAEGTRGRLVHLVAHSMGGLVARAALAHKPGKRLGRIVMLGTPNFGSFSPIQAFRGGHSIVRKVAFIDMVHSEEELARDVFGTFPGLHEMLPSPEKVPTDYFSLASWPEPGVRPNQRRLTAAAEVQRTLPQQHERITLIVGVNQETVVGATIEDDEFVYTTSPDGDGTVPLACALLPTADRTYYVEEEHGSLPNNGDVCRAVEDILGSGQTRALRDRHEPRRNSRSLRRVSERMLDAPPFDGKAGRALSDREQRSLLQEFAAPGRARGAVPQREAVSVAAATRDGATQFSDGIVIGRQLQHRLDITLVHGSITEVDAGAYVLGLFRHVEPGGAARAVDALVDGAVSQIVSRRMFNGNVGEITVLPTGTHPIRTPLLAFAGLGPFDSFGDDVLEVVGENLMRTFATTRISDFATVPVGGGSGMLTLSSLQRLLTGFLRGLLDADKEQRFRGITICETDASRYQAIRSELYRLCATPLFDGVEVTLRERSLPALPPAAGPRAARLPGKESVYLMVRQRSTKRTEPLSISASVLTVGDKATVFKGSCQPQRAALRDLLAEIETNAFEFDRLPDFGRRLSELVLPQNVAKILARFKDRSLVVVHDAAASRIPWETLYIDGSAPARAGGLSHRYEAENLAVAKWLEVRQYGATLDVLLIVDPTGDLAGARREGDRVKEMFDALGSSIRVRELRGNAARRSELLRCFGSGEFDIVHYAGHAYFDSQNPQQSGILCTGDEVLSGSDLVNVGSLPSIVFFNACEAGRIRAPTSRKPSISARMQHNSSFAEAFLRGGVANYVGTYWPVGDAPAVAFARQFYERLLGGAELGQALIAGREADAELESVDWANYILYGDPAFVLKHPAVGS